MKHYSLVLKEEHMRLFLVVEQSSGKMTDSLLVMVLPKAKLEARKWISAVLGKEVTAKDKIECLTTFAMCDFPVKTEHTEDLEFLFGTSNGRDRTNENEQL